MQHLSSINPCVGSDAAEPFWICCPGGSVLYIPYLSKEIMLKEKAKKEVERKNLKISHGRGIERGSCAAERGKDGTCPKGVSWWGWRGRVMLQAAARGDWGTFVASVT